MIDSTSVTGAVAVDPAAGIYQRTSIIVLPAVWNANPNPLVDEVHVRLTRNATANDPVTDPAVHHFAFIQQLNV